MPDTADDVVDEWLCEFLALQPPIATPVVPASPSAATSVEVTFGRAAALELSIPIGRRRCIVKRMPIEVAKEILKAFTDALG